MKLKHIEVSNFKSIKQTGKFNIEPTKNIFVGLNQSGKSALFNAIHYINPTSQVQISIENDYPRSKLTDISGPDISSLNEETIVRAWFSLEEKELVDLGAEFANVLFKIERKYSGEYLISLNGISRYRSKEIHEHVKKIKEFIAQNEGGNEKAKIGYLNNLSEILSIEDRDDPVLRKCIEGVLKIDSLSPGIEISEIENNITYIKEVISRNNDIDFAFRYLENLLPQFVYITRYLPVPSKINLRQIVEKSSRGKIETTDADYVSSCLLNLAQIDAKKILELEPTVDESKDPQKNHNCNIKLQQRDNLLRRASKRLTDLYSSTWVPDTARGELLRVHLGIDGVHLKVCIENENDELIEIDQHSEGFQWLISFYTVLFSETDGNHKNSILLLDEPGLSLHPLKQKNFRSVLTQLSNHNQLLFSTHSPFLIGPDELSLVKVISLKNRQLGTTVSTQIVSDDQSALFPLQDALGYNMAQSLFAKTKNLVVEGITDLFYIEAISSLINSESKSVPNKHLGIIPAGSSSKIIYIALVLKANDIDVSVLFDSDREGVSCAQNHELVHIIPSKNIILMKDVYSGKVDAVEIEDLIRTTLVTIAKNDNNLAWDVENEEQMYPTKPIINIFSDKIGKKSFSKYHLAKAFINWTKEHSIADLPEDERKNCQQLVKTINKSLSGR